MMLTAVLSLVAAGFLLYWDQIKYLATTAPSEVAQDESFPVAIRVVDSPSWLIVIVDGQTVLDQLGEPGFSEQFEVEQEIIIEADNAEAVWVVEQGQELGPIGEGAMRLVLSTEDIESEGPQDSESEGPQDSEPEGPQEEPTTAEAATPSPREESGVRVLVSIVSDGGVGLSILEDGQLAYDQIASPGFSEEFEAEEAIIVTAADGGAVWVGVDGANPEPVGESGERTSRIFTAESQI